MGRPWVGELLFKFTMNKSTIDTRATAMHLEENLTNLDTYMSTVNSNIDNVNQYVKVNVDRFKARDEPTYDMMVNSLKAYQVSSDG